MQGLSRSQQLERYRVESFQWHMATVQRWYLEPWAQQLVASGRRPPPQARLAVLVDDRPGLHLRACVLNTLLMGRMGWRVKWFTSPQALAASEPLLADLGPWVEVIGLAIDGAQSFSWGAYNSLLKDAAFWRCLGAERVLIFQTDTLLMQPPDERVFAYDYVGSPWAQGRVVSVDFPDYDLNLQRSGTSWESRALCSSTPPGVVNGNGGLSVRDCERMAQICERCPSPVEEPEDIYFARCLAAGAVAANLPPQELVQGFSCETQWQACSGAHAAWRYLGGAEVGMLWEQHLKHVQALGSIGIAAEGA
jgi:hypothetical protein